MQPFPDPSRSEPQFMRLWLKVPSVDYYNSVIDANLTARRSSSSDHTMMVTSPVPRGGWDDNEKLMEVKERFARVRLVMLGYMNSDVMGIVTSYMNNTYDEDDIVEADRPTYPDFVALCVYANRCARDKTNQVAPFIHRVVRVTLDILNSLLARVSTGDELVLALSRVFRRRRTKSNTDCVSTHCCSVCESRTWTSRVQTSKKHAVGVRNLENKYRCYSEGNLMRVCTLPPMVEEGDAFSQEIQCRYVISNIFEICDVGEGPVAPDSQSMRQKRRGPRKYIARPICDEKEDVDYIEEKRMAKEEQRTPVRKRKRPAESSDTSPVKKHKAVDGKGRTPTNSR